MNAEISLNVNAEHLRTLPVDGKGRVVIPSEIRDDLGIDPNGTAVIAVLGAGEQ